MSRSGGLAADTVSGEGGGGGASAANVHHDLAAKEYEEQGTGTSCKVSTCCSRYVWLSQPVKKILM